jgi:hypothetical protein
MVSFISKHGSE